jgi:hypothetical protein
MKLQGVVTHRIFPTEIPALQDSWVTKNLVSKSCKIVKFTVQQATNVHKGSRGIAPLFL